MTIPELIDEAITLHREVERASERLAEIEATLKTYAGERPELHELLSDGDREGTQVLLKGERGTLPLIFTADTLLSKVPPGVEPATEMFGLCARHGVSPQLFYAPTTDLYRTISDGKRFRAKVREMLGDDAPAFLRLCASRDKHGIIKNRAVFDYDRAQTL